MIVIHTYTRARVLVKFSVSSTCRKVGIATGIFEYCQCHCAVVFMLGVGIGIFEYCQCHCAVVFMLGVGIGICEYCHCAVVFVHGVPVN